MSRHVDGPASALQRPRRRRVQMNHLVLAPASELPLKEEWRAVVDGLPNSGVLLIFPSKSVALWHTFQRLASQFRAGGRHIQCSSADAYRSLSQLQRAPDPEIT